MKGLGQLEHNSRPFSGFNLELFPSFLWVHVNKLALKSLGQTQIKRPC